MTTPERLRRRQRIEGTFLVLIGLLLIVSTLWFRNQDMVQRECLADNFKTFNDALTVRGELTEREAEVSRREAAVSRLESSATRQLFREAFAAQTREEFDAAYAAYERRLLEIDDARSSIDQEREQIKADRQKTPIPDFPAGTCE